ncbi:MAG: T9SS type A sorting domain-containing protein, partial [Saprospiraceae bacterium]
QVLFVNDSTGIADLVIHPKNHDIIFATGWNRIRNNKKSLVSGPDSKVYKSIDGGQNWEVLKNGLPEDNSSRIGIDISTSNPNVLYACYTHPTTFNLKGVYKSVDGGLHWIPLQLGNSVGLAESIYGGFGWYFGKIRINPNNENDVFILGVDLWRSRNGGQSWARSTPSWSSYEVHADKHDLIFEGSNMYLTTDGGAYTSDINTVSWIDIENIPATQFYRVGYNPTDPDRYFGGAQDNGTTGGSALEMDTWKRINGGDGFQPLFHPQNSNIFYVETQNGGFLSTINKGIGFQDATKGISDNDPRNWDMPVIMSHHNPDVLYTGTNKIYQNAKGPIADWKAISPDLTDQTSEFLRHNISAIHESDTDPDVIAAGTSDGLVWISVNSGDTWQNISQGLPRKYVSSIYFSPGSANTIFVSYTGYKDNDNTPHIYMSNNFGKTWQSVQGNMPNVAINNILVLPPDGNNAITPIFVATDAGVFYTSNHGVEWKRMGDNMPFVTVYDVDYNPKNNVLIAGTFGRSIMTFDLGQIGYKNVLSGTGISFHDDLILYPSIVSNSEDIYIRSQANDWSLVLYSIYNSSGILVKSGASGYGNGNKAISTSGLTKGIHFVVITTGGQVLSKTHKVIIL